VATGSSFSSLQRRRLALPSEMTNRTRSGGWCCLYYWCCYYSFQLDAGIYLINIF
jgi:hypothetical protein